MRAMLVIVASLCTAAPAAAEPPAPWGRAQERQVDYHPHKVVYDVVTGDPRKMENLLDRASYLNVLYEADPFESSIVLVLHGEVIHLFARENLARYRELMTRAQALTVGTTIEFRMCRLAAKSLGYEPEDIHGFVRMVPMADAELVRLQAEEGYAYMQ